LTVVNSCFTAESDYNSNGCYTTLWNSWEY